ncbi:hypothetical protein DM01DRAFT_1333085 [Hesseltinella vesiculosa]|uniref:Uncharacterized protein n=1 Tax=Hesseltinella vesiculosa TaxID=101127 RepID=A0A1X2GSN9_9FUNG|nr:hypothetical protein DM01DRAFT_1333085 [Hesseltinella vesiculosa]
MPPRYLSSQQSTQRPLQNEIATLNKLLGNDILENASRILDHFAVTHSSKAGIESSEPPRYLVERLLEKCDSFDSVCDQIYYILEQSKHTLELQLVQNKVTTEKKTLEDAERQRQQQQEHEVDRQISHMVHPEDDLALGNSNGLGDHIIDLEDTAMEMDVDEQHHHKLSAEVDEEELEELLQIQKDRLDRVKKVMVLGLDAAQVNTESGKGNKDDLLF